MIMEKAELQRRLTAIGNLNTVAKETGLAYNTVKNLMEGKGVRYETIERVSRFFNSRHRKSSGE
jgi:hypothetical protein